MLERPGDLWAIWQFHTAVFSNAQGIGLESRDERTFVKI